MTEKAKTKTGSDFFDQALQSCEQAFKTSLKLQEDAAKMWTSLYTKVPSMADYQKQATHLGEDSVKLFQKQVDESLQLVDDCSRASLDLFKKAVETTQSASVAEGQVKLQKLWESSLNSMQANTQAVVNLSQRLLNSWTEFARKGAAVAEAAAK